MSIWQRLLRILGYRGPTRFSFPVEEELLQSLQDLSERERRTREEAAAGLFSTGLDEWCKEEENSRRWHELTRREQEIAALICMDYTNRQIASRLRISEETVKSHTTKILHKFNVKGKFQLRMLLSDWDFSEWIQGSKKQ